MGRELKRVPLDFDWPRDKLWKGYVNPYHVPCPACDGNGLTLARQWLEQLVHLMLATGGDYLEEQRGRDIHPWLFNLPLAPNGRPGKEMAELTGGLSDRAPRDPFGHDSCDRWTATKKIIAAAGLPETWGWCSHCKGEGIAPEVKEAYENWQKEDPPTGEGYQLWTTTTEGAPISPVFKTLDELCSWAANHATTFGSYKATAEEWRQMLDDGLVYHRQGNAVFL